MAVMVRPSCGGRQAVRNHSPVSVRLSTGAVHLRRPTPRHSALLGRNASNLRVSTKRPLRNRGGCPVHPEARSTQIQWSTQCQFGVVPHRRPCGVPQRLRRKSSQAPAIARAARHCAVWLPERGGRPQCCLTLPSRGTSTSKLRLLAAAPHVKR
jgi:hypothetical protein